MSPEGEQKNSQTKHLLKAEAKGDTSSLLLKDQWRAANSVDYQKDRHLDAIGNLDERNTAIHAVVLSIKGHCSRNLPVARPLSRTNQMQCFVLRDSANCELARKVGGVWTGLYNLCGVKCNVRVLSDVEEIFAFQLSILHPASGINAACLNLNI